MKKFTFTAIAMGLATLLTGCNKYGVTLPKNIENTEYYAENVEKAEKVIKECEKIENEANKYLQSLPNKLERDEFKNYLKENGLDTFNKNCKNAKDGIAKAERNAYEANWENEQAEKEQNELQGEETRKLAFEDYAKKVESEFIDSTWQESISNILNSGVDLYFGSNNHLEAKYLSKYIDEELPNIHEFMKDIYDTSYDRYISRYGKEEDRKENLEGTKNSIITYIYIQQRILGIKELLKRSYDELASDTSNCKADKRKYSVCNIWQDAVIEKRKNIIQEYVSDYEKLKTDYNQCVSQLDEHLASLNVKKGDYNISYDIRSEIKEKESSIYKGYPCAETEEALKELKLPFDHYEKLD